MENKTISEWAEMLKEQIQAGASQSDIMQLLKEYENQALRIHDVVGRSEQLRAFAQWYEYNYQFQISDRSIEEYERYGS